MCKYGHRRRIGVVISRNINRLHRSNWPVFSPRWFFPGLRPFPMPALADNRQPMAFYPKRRNFRTGLGKTENVIDKSNTSSFFTSLKYSAIVSAVKATRSLFAGGSFICPNTITVLSRTLASFISSHKSLPSLVLSPTPAKTECPLCSIAIFRINSLTINGFSDSGSAKNGGFSTFGKRRH